MSRHYLDATMRWPLPVPMLWWVGDYTDIRERVRRDGRLDRDEVWLPDSDDGWPSFCNRHGDYNFHADWATLRERDRVRVERAKQRAAARLSTVAQREQERWEADQRRQQAIKQARADQEWREAEAKAEAARQAALIAEAAAKTQREIAAARAFWSGRDAAYATGPYQSLPITVTGVVAGVRLEAGNSYWLPAPLAEQIKNYSALRQREQT